MNYRDSVGQRYQYFMNRWMRCVRRRGHDVIAEQSGAAAIEFGLVALPFFLLFIGLVELGLVMMGYVTIETASAISGREASIGAGAGVDEEDLQERIRTLVSDISSGLVNGEDVRITTAVETAFGDLPLRERCLDPKGFPPTCDGAFEDLDGDGIYEPDPPPLDLGGPGDIISIRIFYNYEFFTPLIGDIFSNTGDGRFVISSAYAYRNEPSE